jgi:hypothetical protein
MSGRLLMKSPGMEALSSEIDAQRGGAIAVQRVSDRSEANSHPSVTAVTIRLCHEIDSKPDRHEIWPFTVERRSPLGRTSTPLVTVAASRSPNRRVEC